MPTTYTFLMPLSLSILTRRVSKLLVLSYKAEYASTNLLSPFCTIISSFTVLTVARSAASPLGPCRQWSGHAVCFIFLHFGSGLPPPHAAQARLSLPHVGLFVHVGLFF